MREFTKLWMIVFNNYTVLVPPPHSKRLAWRVAKRCRDGVTDGKVANRRLSVS